MSDYSEKNGMLVARKLSEFVEHDLLVDTRLNSAQFWKEFSGIVQDLAPKNKDLLSKREELQKTIDGWHREQRGKEFSSSAYKSFLSQIGYFLPESEEFEITTTNVDPEIATIAGPQLVVPVTNARFALNAANARWGSLYDALYGTDVIDSEEGKEISSDYNSIRGAAVVAYATNFLDTFTPLLTGSHADVSFYSVVDGILQAGDTTLVDTTQFAGYQGEPNNPSAILLKHNGLHIDIQINRDHPIGSESRAGVKDIVMEAAITTIQDMEDSVAAVDAEDKVLSYKNLLGLYRGDLEDTFEKQGAMITRRLNSDREFRSPNGGKLILSGRSLMLVRNVGHLMTTSSVLDQNGNEVPEGIMDAFFTGVIGLQDLNGRSQLTNSRAGSIYIVKPKMHGPQEVEFTCELFARVEAAIGLPKNTLKLGIMDEERRTTLNLKECVRMASERVVFINTGFLDRTGDEIHTSMEAGPFLPKGEIKLARWIEAYENWNVDIGLETGMRGKSQIGKGMWAMPDEMAQMMESKISHPRAGANTAWVPSPTAATLHAIHYHNVDVSSRQEELVDRQRASMDAILEIPLLGGRNLSEDEIQLELDNNCQGILGYVVRWVDQGIGCSKVPDINNVGLMEDRATLRISSQHIANWLYHGVCNEEQVMETMKRMARVVDGQNTNDPNYRNMADNFVTSLAFSAACDLVFKGREQPSGYTEPILHAKRQETKAVGV